MAKNKNKDSGSDSADLSLTAIIKALDSGEPMPDALSSTEQDPFDPNATMNYQQAGVSFPEFPFADENNAVIEPSPSKQKRSRESNQQERSDAERTSSARQSRRTTASEVRSEAARKSAPASQFSRVSPEPTTRAARRTFDSASYDAPSTSFRPVNTQQPSYRIRGGGGGNYNPRSPVLLGASLLLVIIGVVIMGFGLNNVLGSLSGGSTTADFELTSEETRTAIDSHIPVLIDYVDYTIEDATAVISESQFVYTNDRHTPDSPDASAANIELVSMPQEMSSEQMEGYYSGSYNAYSLEELGEYFNGSYVLDLARGELGSWNKLRYVNFNSTSIEDEMAHLAEFQGLTGETVTISAEGVDTRGNLVIQGQKVIDGEVVRYFKIAACPFKDLYNASSLSDTSVYITCTVADYDFFTGADEITPVAE